MAKIGLFYGSTTGKSQAAAEAIQDALGGEKMVALHKITDATDSDFSNCDRLIIACPTREKS